MIIQRKLFSIKDADDFEQFIESNLGLDIEAEDWDELFNELNNKMKESIVKIVSDKKKLKDYILDYENPYNKSALSDYGISQNDLGKYLKVFSISLINGNTRNINFNINVEIEKPGTKFLGFWTIYFTVNSLGVIEMSDISYND